jgi:type IV secretory pathway VirJ component
MARHWLVTVLVAGTLGSGRAGASRLDELPLIIENPIGAARGTVVFISGDGGWTKIAADVTAELLAAGYGVVGLNANKYFGSLKTPDEIAADVSLIANHYAKEWRVEPLLLFGYSRGADVLPFVVPRLEASQRAQVQSVVLLGPAPYTHFQIHLTDFISDRRRSDSVDVLPEADKVERPIICVYGTDEDQSLCPLLTAKAIKIAIDGGHHFDGDYRGIAKQVLSLIPEAMAR